MSGRESHYFECACSADEHTLRLMIYDDGGDGSYEPDLFASIFLAELPFWQRLCLGIKYIFGYKCRFGHFQESVLSDLDTARRLRDLLNTYITVRESWEAKG